MDYLNTIEYRIKPTQALKIIRNCSGCGRKAFFVSTGQFRVNANGSLVDIWLVYQCEKCRHTYNLTIYERTKANKIAKEQYLAYLRNDEELALKCGTNLNLLKKNKAEADIDGLEYQYENVKTEAKDGCSRIIIQNPYRLKVRIDRLLPELMGISRSQMKKMMQEGKICFEGTYLAETTEIIIN